jgi:superfamily I DNA/RNA helicase
LADYLSDVLADVPAITVMNFHELVRTRVLAAGLLFQVPEDLQQRIKFFRDDCPELLINAVELLGESFDTLIVDEGADFTATWWVALELLGRQDFSWYCFFDRQQTLYQDNKDWVPPFNAVSFILDTNLRNTRPIGEQAAKWGQIDRPNAFRIEEGLLPEIQYSLNFSLMGGQLKQLLRNLINREHIAPERIVVLSPYRHTNAKSTWSGGLSEVTISTLMHKTITGCVRVGTLQGFKGLEADVIILVGLDDQATSHPEWLYVGASRAKVALYALFLESTIGLMTTLA